MKRIYYLLLALPLMAMCFASCEKNEKNKEEWTDDSPIIQFKDPYFLEALLEMPHIADIDKNRDGQISEKEASIVTTVNVNKMDDGVKKIRAMDELKYFTALETLSCEGNQLTSLDVSNNTALTDLNCSKNQLTSLDLSKNTALTGLYCVQNQLTSLDVSNNTALTTLNCAQNQLTSLDVSNNTALTDLSCSNNQLTSLDLSKNTALTDLSCSNNQLTSLDLSKNTALTDLRCYNNPLTSLDLSKCKKIVILFCVEFSAGNIENTLDLNTKCPLESLKIYKYHVIRDDFMSVLEKVYGDIIEYVE